MGIKQNMMYASFLFFISLLGVLLSPCSSGGKWVILNEGSHPHSQVFNSGTFLNYETGLVIGSNEVLATRDGGNTWTAVFSDDALNLNEGILSESGVGIVFGSRGPRPALITTIDSGLHWKELPIKANDGLENSRLLSGCFVPPNDLKIAGENGIIRGRLENNEVSMHESLKTEGSVLSMSCNGNEMWAVGENGLIYQFKDQWQKKGKQSRSMFTRVRQINNNVWVLGQTFDQKALLLKSSDGGATWVNKAPVKNGALFDIYLSQKEGWLVGADGEIYFTKDGGDSWEVAVSPTKNDLLGLSCIDIQNCWAFGDKATVLKLKS